jgi:hypothetical protein
MPFVLPKPGGWGLEDALTSAQVTALQAGIAAADAGVTAAGVALSALQVKALFTLSRNALSLRQIIRAGVAITDSAVSMAAVQTRQSVPIVAMKIGNAMLCDDADRFIAGGALASITSLVTAAASAPTPRISVLGTGGTFGCTSINNGGGWSAFGAGLPSAQDCIIYTPANNVFLASATGATIVYRSSTGASVWGSATLPGGALVQSLANVSGTIVALVTLAGVTKFCISNDGGLTFAAAASAPPSAPFVGIAGTIVGNGGSLCFHVANINSVQMQVSSSPDGLVWTALATITASAGGSFSARPRILMCQNTGLLVIVASHSDGMSMLYASDDLGQTWTAPKAVTIAPAGFAVAGGRLFATDGIMLLASTGIGWPS